jgi:hypothetical protein
MIVASRCLKLRKADSEIDVAVRLFEPRSDQNYWSCDFEIDWPEGTRKGTAHGFDSMQALVLALNMVGSEIYTSDYHKSGALSWGEPRKGYGFPLPRIIRDMLIGDDAEYF